MTEPTNRTITPTPDNSLRREWLKLAAQWQRVADSTYTGEVLRRVAQDKADECRAKAYQRSEDS